MKRRSSRIVSPTKPRQVARVEHTPSSVDLRVLRNPHSALAAVKKRPNAVLELRISDPDSSRRRLEPAWQKVFDAVETRGLPIRDKGGGALRREVESGRGSSTPELILQPREPIAFETMIERSQDQESGIWLALDCIQDPHNLGAIFRLAGFFGVCGILLLEDRASRLTDVVYDVSCGGVEALPHSIEVNLSRSLELAKQAGFWILGTSERATVSINTLTLDRKWLVVLGNEENGMRRLTAERCDLVATIPCRGDVTSLNVSTAASVLLAHLAGSNSK